MAVREGSDVGSVKNARFRLVMSAADDAGRERSNVGGRILRVLREVLDDDDLVVTDDTTALDVEGWDSLAHLNIMFTLESEFHVEFDDDQLCAFRTVGQLRSFLEAATSN